MYCCFSVSFSNTKPMNVFWNCSLNLLKDKDKMQSLQLQCCDCWCTGDGYNWGICRHNILSGTIINSEHDDLVTGGPRASANIIFSEKKKMCTVAFLFHFPTLMYVDTLTLLSQKRQYNAKFAFCHVMTADDLLKCGPTGISGHNCIYLKIYRSISVLKSHLDMSRLSLKEKNVYADMAQIVLVSIL